LNELNERIAGEIRAKGSITFARFMELALYCPNCGYYEREEDTIGRRGDYYTNVSVGSVFGELLAFQFAEWLQADGCESVGNTAGEARRAFRVVEAGAHGGDLARDILSWLREHRAGLFERLEYWVVEPSPRRRGWQQRKLHGFEHTVRWVHEIEDLSGTVASRSRNQHMPALRAVLFANEFLDALPVRRLGWDAKRRAWFEWCVTLKAGRFVWTRVESAMLGEGGVLGGVHASSSCRPPLVGQGLLGVLPDGFTIELCPAAERWWHMAAMALGSGKLLTIDYGLTTGELFVPERAGGTLRAYSRHRLTSDLLAWPGDQDITAHVDFEAIQAVGEAAGLATEALLTQAQFLTNLATRYWSKEATSGIQVGKRTRQLQTLVHPDHLGQSFRVLVQSRT
jgi:SAM-dependent MidA family methyltransferase